MDGYNTFFLKSHLWLCSIVLIFTALWGCSSGSSSNNSASGNTTLSTPANAYTGPGSKWDVTLAADSTFEIVMRETIQSEPSLQISGNYTRLNNGFLDMVVTEASGDNAPEPEQRAWALDVPGFAMFLRADDRDDGGFVAMVESGGCPSNSITSNWVVVNSHNQADATESDRDFFGTFTYNTTNGEAHLPSRYALANFESTGPGEILATANCDNGIIQVDDALLYLSASSVGLVHTNIDSAEDGHIIFALPSEAINAVDVFDGTHSSLLFNQAPLANDVSVNPGSLTCSAGLCSGTLWDNPNDESPTHNVVVRLTGSLNFPELGMITGEIEINNGVGNLACTLSSSGPNLLTSCVGQSPQDNTKILNLIMVAQS